MRILLGLIHYFRAEDGAPYSSTKENLREARGAAVRLVIDAWRGHFGPSTVLNRRMQRFELQRGMEDTLHIVAIVNGSDHLLDREYCAAREVQLFDAKIEDPRMLGFTAQKLFADSLNGYDMFVYSEDDLLPGDGALLSRVQAFQEEFGWRRLLLPNRYEWNTSAKRLKTFIDGDLRPELVEKYEAAQRDEEFLRHRFPGRMVTYRRATNPHAGFYAITVEQMTYWMRQPHFGDQDCSYVAPLDSAATLGMLKTFPIYKAFGRDAGWFEIQHLDNRFSSKLKV